MLNAHRACWSGKATTTTTQTAVREGIPLQIMGVTCIVTSPANPPTPANFYIPPEGSIEWTNKVFRSNLSYFRIRRELFSDFVALLTVQEGTPVICISDETFLVIRQFLTARNETLDDNKRLSFDRACLDMHHLCINAMRKHGPGPNPAVTPAPSTLPGTPSQPTPAQEVAVGTANPTPISVEINSPRRSGSFLGLS